MNLAVRDVVAHTSGDNWCFHQAFLYSIDICSHTIIKHPDSKVLGANMGPIWGRQDRGGPHVGPMNFVIWPLFNELCYTYWARLCSRYYELTYRQVVLRCVFTVDNDMQPCCGNVKTSTASWRDVNSLLMHWSFISFALSHQHDTNR